MSAADKDLSILSADCSYNEQAKAQFHATAKKYLKRLADAMGLKARKDYDLRSCLGGIAVAGEAILHTDTVYIMVMSPTQAMRSGSVLVRTCKGRKDYSGGVNQYVSIETLVDTPAMVKAVEKIAPRRLKDAV